MPPKARGGLHARIAAAAADVAPPPEVPSQLANLLLNQWIWGDMSALQLQKTAAAAVADGADHRELKLLASIGSHGTMANNCHRDLAQYRLQKPEIERALTNITIWMRKAPLRTLEAQQQILLPHELFAAVHQYHPDAFRTHILGGGPAKFSVVPDGGRIWVHEMGGMVGMGEGG